MFGGKFPAECNANRVLKNEFKLFQVERGRKVQFIPLFTYSAKVYLASTVWLALLSVTCLRIQSLEIELKAIWLQLHYTGTPPKRTMTFWERAGAQGR